MLGADPALVGAEQPALEQARDAMHTWHHDVRRVVVLADHGPLVRVAVLGDGPVRLPPSGVDSRAGLTTASMNGIGRCGETSSTECSRIRPKPLGCLISTAIATIDLVAVSRPGTAPSTPPTYASSTSTQPLRRGRPGRTIAKRNRCSIAPAVW